MLTFLAAATALTLPIPNSHQMGGVYQQLSFIEDFYGKDVAALVQLWVDDKGRILDCSIEGAIGTRRLVERACETLVGQRIKRPQAKGFAGVYGLFRATWYFKDDRIVYNKSSYEDMIAQLDQIVVRYGQQVVIPGLAEPDFVSLALHIDGDGKVINCEAVKAEAPDIGAFCQQAGTRVFEKRTGSSGLPVTYVRNFVIKLTGG